MKPMYCKNCGFQGKPRKKTRGYFAVELILWCMLILPGLLYTLWRATNRYTACPKCGQENMIPFDSPYLREIGMVPIIPVTASDPIDPEEAERRRIEATLPPQDETGRFIIK